MSWLKSGSLLSWEEIEIFRFDLMCCLGCTTLYLFCVLWSFLKTMFCVPASFHRSEDGTDMRRFNVITGVITEHKRRDIITIVITTGSSATLTAHRRVTGLPVRVVTKPTLFLIWRKDPAAFTEFSGVSKEAWWTKIDKAFVDVDLIGIRISGDQCFSGFHWHLHWHLARPHH